MTDTQADELINRLHQHLRQALKNGERTKLSTLRSLLARITNAEAVAPSGDHAEANSPIAGAAAGVGSTERPRKQLTLAEIHSLVGAEMAEIKATLESLDPTSDYAAELREKAAIIQRYAN